MQPSKNSHQTNGGQISYQALLLTEMYEIARIMGIGKTNNLHLILMALYPEECIGCTITSSSQVINCHKLLA